MNYSYIQPISEPRNQARRATDKLGASGAAASC